MIGILDIIQITAKLLLKFEKLKKIMTVTFKQEFVLFRQETFGNV